jgi:Tol biopolymer transport system component
LLAYCKGSELFVAKSDGSESRKLVTMKNPDFVFNPVWSPDGNHLRFDVQESLGGLPSLWEVSIDGTGLHRLLPGLNSPPNWECCGSWTSDGKYFVFRSRRQIWALPRKKGLFESSPQPIQLTFSPLNLGPPLPSADGKKLFVVGRTFRGELVRYDAKSKQLTPFLGGISAEFVAFSNDGQWVAYVSFPEGALWRSKADGSERLQLTYPPSQALLPRWSPDGKKIVFYETFPDKPPRIFEVSREGGSPRQLMPDNPDPQVDPHWSPDGNTIVFGGNPGDPASSIRILDLATHQISTLPGSGGLFSPSWSPDGRYIPALSADMKRLLLFDFQSQKWTELATGGFGFSNWTKDGQYLQFLSSGAGAVIKIRVSDGKRETVLDLKSIGLTGRWGHSIGLAPDDSPLLLRDAGTQDVYSLDWEEP